MQEPISIKPDAVYDDGALYLSLGLTPAALTKARRDCELRFTRKGKRTLYLGQWVLAWLQATATTDAGQTPQGVADGKSTFRPTTTPTTSTAGGHTAKTTNGIAHVAPGEAGGIVPELLTERQAAALCGIGARTLWRWSRSGLAPRPIKIGFGRRAAVRYSRQALLQWVADGCPRTDGRTAR